MNYAIARTVNGIFSIASEHGDNLQSALVAFHSQCQALWNEESVLTATVKIVDENLETVMGKVESIGHIPAVEINPEPEEEPAEPTE